MVTRLSDGLRAESLATLPGWTHEPQRDAITRQFTFRDFNEAFGFMARVALAAQQADHHPDWSNSYDTVTIKLSTHDAGGLSQKDIDLAAAIDKLIA